MPQPAAPDTAKGAFLELADVLGWNEKTRKLVLAFMIGCVNTSGTYPILVVQGGQGSGKSSLTRLVKLTLDPDDTPIRSAPASERDLAISAAQTHLLAFDNLSGVSQALSDGFCRMSTGGGYRTRKLYAGREEERFKLSNPLILNGIDQIATRNDLADRAIVIHLPDIPGGTRMSEGALEANWQAILPRVLGELCTAWSMALRKFESIELDTDFRMMDFATWIAAAEGGVKGELGLLDAYEQSIRDAALEAVEYDPVSTAIVKLSHTNQLWRGSAQDLKLALTGFTDSGRIEHVSVESFANAVRRAMPVLRKVGVLVYTDEQKDPHRRVTIYNVRSEGHIASSLN